MRNKLLRYAIMLGLWWGSVQGLVVLGGANMLDFITGMAAGLWLALLIVIMQREIAKHQTEAADATQS